MIAQQVMFGIVIVTALLCSTWLSTQRLFWMAAAMLAFAVVALFIAGGVEIPARAKDRDLGVLR